MIHYECLNLRVIINIGQLTLFPTSVASVCRVGDPLQLTCTAHVESGIKWDIFQSESTFRFVDDYSHFKLREVLSVSVVLLELYLLDLIQQHAQGMENGNLTQEG